MQADAAIIAENYRAMNAMADNILHAIQTDAQEKQAAYTVARRAYRAALTIRDVTKETPMRDQSRARPVSHRDDSVMWVELWVIT